MVDKTLKDLKLGSDMIKCAPGVTGARWDLGAQLEAETSLGNPTVMGPRDDEAGGTRAIVWPAADEADRADRP